MESPCWNNSAACPGAPVFNISRWYCQDCPCLALVARSALLLLLSESASQKRREDEGLDYPSDLAVGDLGSSNPRFVPRDRPPQVPAQSRDYGRREERDSPDRWLTVALGLTWAKWQRVGGVASSHLPTGYRLLISLAKIANTFVDGSPWMVRATAQVRGEM